MLRKTFFLACAAILLVLATTSQAKAWAAYHYSYGGSRGGAYGGFGGYHYGGYHYGYGGAGYHYGYNRSW